MVAPLHTFGLHFGLVDLDLLHLLHIARLRIADCGSHTLPSWPWITWIRPPPVPTFAHTVGFQDTHPTHRLPHTQFPVTLVPIHTFLYPFPPRLPFTHIAFRLGWIAHVRPTVGYIYPTHTVWLHIPYTTLPFPCPLDYIGLHLRLHADYLCCLVTMPHLLSYIPRIVDHTFARSIWVAPQIYTHL